MIYKYFYNYISAMQFDNLYLYKRQTQSLTLWTNLAVLLPDTEVSKARFPKL